MSDTLQIVKYFTDICLEKNLDKIIEFCKSKEFIDIIKKQLEEEEEETSEEEEDCILNNFFKNIIEKEEYKEFIKNLIYNEKIDNVLIISLIKILIKFASNSEEIDNLINDEKIGKIIQNNIITFENFNPFDNILIYTSLHSYNSNYEFFTIKILENKNIMKALLESNENESIINCIFNNSVVNPYYMTFNKGTGVNIKILEKILENKDIIKKLYDNVAFSDFIMDIPCFEYRNCFDIFFDNAIKDKISEDGVNGCFNNSIKNERTDILEKLLSSDLVNKINDSCVLDSFVYLCENNKIEFIDLLINNEIILEKFVECFKIACDHKNEDIVRLLLSIEKIKEKIGENRIKEGKRKILFLKSCDREDVSLAEYFVINKSYILTEETIDKLNEEGTPLLYNIFNKNDFNEEDIRAAEILIDKGLKINNTNETVRENINKLIEYLDNEGKVLKKQHFGIINYKKLKKTEEAIERIKIFINMKKFSNDISINLTEIEDGFDLISKE